jgi:hypothetical protein
MYGEWQLEEAASEARIKLAERQAAAVALAKFTTLTPEEIQLFQQAEELAAQGREGIRFERWLDKRMSDSFGE